MDCCSQRGVERIPRPGARSKNIRCRGRGAGKPPKTQLVWPGLLLFLFAAHVATFFAFCPGLLQRVLQDTGLLSELFEESGC